MVLAAIDIGSNAARLLISETSVYKGGKVDFTKLNLLRIPLRLGFDVFEKGYITEDKKQALLKTMKAYKLLLDIYKVDFFKACATSAMREARNGEEICLEVEKQTGIPVSIINGGEEAKIIYETHVAEMLSPNKSYLYIDVGGGSTEVTLFSKEARVFNESFNIGTIRLLQDLVTDNDWEQMKNFIKTKIKNLQQLEAIGSGGNINKIFSLSKKKEGKSLSLAALKDYYNEMSRSTLQERKHRYGLRDDRADVIVPAMQIFISLMRWTNANEIYVPRIGLADGIIRMLYREQQTEKKDGDL